jgi:hypothetical protein
MVKWMKNLYKQLFIHIGKYSFMIHYSNHTLFLENKDKNYIIRMMRVDKNKKPSFGILNKDCL